MTAGSAGHASATSLEADVCSEMSRQGVAHQHRSLRYRVHDRRGAVVPYAPAIVARRGAILFLVEPVVAYADGDETVERLSRFLGQHSPEIVFVVVAPDELVRRIPRDAYDEVYGASDIPRLATRIREQDPEGLIRPFEKLPPE